METINYNSDFIHDFATRLYRAAGRIVLKYSIIGAFIGLLCFPVIGFMLGFKDGIGPIFMAVLGLLIGYSLGVILLKKKPIQFVFRRRLHFVRHRLS